MVILPSSPLSHYMLKDVTPLEELSDCIMLAAMLPEAMPSAHRSSLPIKGRSSFPSILILLQSTSRFDSMASRNVRKIDEDDVGPSPSASGASPPVVVSAAIIIENLVERIEKLERTARQRSCGDLESETASDNEDESRCKSHIDQKKYEHDAERRDDDIEKEDASNEADPRALIKKLYEGKSKCKCCTNWVPKFPKGIEKPTEQTKESWRCAALHSVTIQSLHLRKLAQIVLAVYPASDTSPQKLVFKAPFWPFYHSWNHLKKYRASILHRSDDYEETEHVNTLRDVLNQELRDAPTTSEDLAANGNIDFDLFWTIFPPGCVAFERTGTVDRWYLVTDCEEGATKRSESNNLLLHLAYLDYDVIDRLIERGNKAKSLVAGSYEAYRGFIDNHKSEPWIDGRVMIDTTEYYKNMSSRYFVASLYPIGLRPIVPAGEVCLAGTDGDDVAKNTVIEGIHMVPPPPVAGELGDPFSGLNFGDMPPMPPIPHSPPGPSKSKKKGKKQGKYPTVNDFQWGFEPEPMPDEEGRGTEPAVSTSMEVMHSWTTKVFGIEPEAFCPPTITGYCLTTKVWTSFAVDSVYDTEWNDVAFEKLVMRRPRKRSLKALVQEHKKHRNLSDEIFRDKGQGLVLLLAGPPGTGKTLTAESVADRLRLPLYALDANQLGKCNDYDPDTIEEELNKVFKLAATWDAVLLLEEADAFLEPRVDDDDARERNKPFLRVLEYYKGILILTTNRSTQFDDALYSRIHLTLRFPELDEGAKKAVWRTFLNPVTVNITEQDFDDLAQEDMNGRQIKNVVKMARLLAEAEDESLSIDHLLDVISVINDSDTEIRDVDVDDSASESTERESVVDERKSEPGNPADTFANIGEPEPTPDPDGIQGPFAWPKFSAFPSAGVPPTDKHTIKLPAGRGSKWSYSVSVG
ncbi:hypothetical protein DOTSEDRAFT_55206 [Dothistroma septosporum NZE10]|uniref:AAA+ ATPase domain-containing protein n=1 Tax=Dothistroma septosporum (strain NZE10 / CBS 128990) TaxID=675120 RepID=N1PGV8_DOTSN|nr:hypothetical protein DOTSEDRAFT_55206 [Dothistroma septosporum NZE10]